MAKSFKFDQQIQDDEIILIDKLIVGAQCFIGTISSSYFVIIIFASFFVAIIFIFSFVFKFSRLFSYVCHLTVLLPCKTLC